MPLIVDQVDPAVLQQPPPRTLPLLLLPNLLGEYLISLPLRAYFDRVIIGVLISAMLIVFLDASRLAWVLLGLVLLIRLGVLIWKISRHVHEDMSLLKHGVIISAHILRIRSGPTVRGKASGWYLDCAMPVGPRRMSLGSVWLADLRETHRLHQQGRVRVICLPRAPGTWRLLEGQGLEACYYEPLNQTQGEHGQ